MLVYVILCGFDRGNRRGAAAAVGTLLFQATFLPMDSILPAL